MTYTNFDYIKRQILTLPAIYWAVQEGETGRQYLGRQDDEIEPIESADKLEALLKSLTSGVVQVKIMQRPQKEINNSTDKYGGTYKYNYKVSSLLGSQPPTLQSVPTSIGSSVPLQQYLDEVQKCNELRLKVHALEIELREAQESKTSALNEMLTPVLMKLAENPGEAMAAIGSIFRPQKTDQ